MDHINPMNSINSMEKVSHNTISIQAPNEHAGKSISAGRKNISDLTQTVKNTMDSSTGNSADEPRTAMAGAGYYNVKATRSIPKLVITEVLITLCVAAVVAALVLTLGQILVTVASVAIGISALCLINYLLLKTDWLQNMTGKPLKPAASCDRNNRHIGGTLPDPKLVPRQFGGNCVPLATCAALQEARKWYSISDSAILNSYRSHHLSLKGYPLGFIDDALEKSGIQFEHFSKKYGTKNKLSGNLINDLRKTNTELAIVENGYHCYMVIKSDHSPTGYLGLNRSFGIFSRRHIKYKALPAREGYSTFTRIYPPEVKH